MNYLSVSQFAEKYGLSERSVRYQCKTGKIVGAFRTGKMWNIPLGAEILSKKMKEFPLLKRLRMEKSAHFKGGIYHRIQIELTYNSNHLEGSQLTEEQTRFIFETHTLYEMILCISLGIRFAPSDVRFNTHSGQVEKQLPVGAARVAPNGFGALQTHNGFFN